jgi:hypothetical protein
VRRALAAALTAAVLLAGCGGGGGSDTPKVVTKALYIAQADEVCAGLSERFNSAGASDPTTPKEIVDSANVLADLYGDLRDGLRKLKLPSRAPDRIGAQLYVTSVNSTNALLGQLRSSAQSFEDAVKAKNARKIESTGNDVRSALDAFRAAQAQANTRAIAYGFNLCGNLN